VADVQTTVMLGVEPQLEISLNAVQQSVSISWQSTVGHTYTVQAVQELSGAWTSLPEFSDKPGTGQVMTFTPQVQSSSNSTGSKSVETQ